MSWPTACLSDVAPAKPLKVSGVSANQEIWQITLDHLEADTGRFLERKIQPYSEAGTSTHWFDERYVLYSKLRPYLNKVALPDQRGLGTTELVPMLPDPKRLDRNYLSYYLRSPKFVNWVSGQTSGAKMPRVSMKVFWQHEISLPPLSEQKRIAAILDKADNLRRKRQEAIQLADEFLRSVFLDMFGDPVTNPKGWDVIDVDSICTNIVDCINKTAKTVDYETPYKMIRTTNVRDYRINIEQVRYVERAIFENWTRRLLPKRGDIVFTREAPAGEAGIIDFDDEVFLGQRTMQYRPDTSVIVAHYFLFELMSTRIKWQIEKMSSGSTVKHLSVPECKRFSIRLPPMELQEKFSEIVSGLYSLRSMKEKANIEGQQLSDSIVCELVGK